MKFRYRPAPAVLTLLALVFAFALQGATANAQINPGWIWGDNAFGQLLDGTTTSRNKPIPLTGLPKDAVSVVAGSSHAIALTSGGKVLAWGANAYGQLGDGTNTNRTKPVTLAGLKGIVQIATGAVHREERIFYHSKSIGSYQIFSMRLDGTDVRQITFDSSDNVYPVINTMGDKIAFASNRNDPNQQYHIYTCSPNGESVTQVTTDIGENPHWSPDGKQIAFVGVLNNKAVPYIIGVDGTNEHCLDTSLDKSVSIWDWSSDGKSILGSLDVPYSIQHQILIWSIYGSKSSIPNITFDNIVFTRFSPNKKQVAFVGLSARWDVYTVNTDGSDLRQLTSKSDNINGSVSSLSWSPDGSEITWGIASSTDGSDGVWLMHSDGSNKIQLTSVGSNTATQTNSWGYVQSQNGVAHSLALASDGTLWAWGDNSFGQLGAGDNTSRNAPVNVLANVAQVCAGGGFTVALKIDGTVWAWGLGANGQLGNGQTANQNAPVQVTGLAGIVQIATGDGYALALKSDGTVWAWGSNSDGQLGDGTTSDQMSPVAVTGLTNAVQVATGDNFSLAVIADGSLWSWGNNAHGQLGDGTTTNNPIPTALFSIGGVQQVSAGSSHVLAVAADGSVWAWGNDASGQLGDGNSVDNPNPTQVQGLAGQNFVSAGANFSVSMNASVRASAASATSITLPVGARYYPTGYLKNRGMLSLQQPLYFFLDGFYIGALATAADGKSKLPPINTLPVGIHTVAVVYLGNPLWLGSVGRGVITIMKSDTTPVMSSPTAQIGQTVNLVFRLKRNSDNTFQPNKTLTVTLNGAAIGSVVTGADGTATIPYTITESNPLGANTFSIAFAGDKSYNASTGAGILVVTQSRTKITVSNPAGRQGTTVILKAVLRCVANSTPLSGKTLRFKVNGVAAGTAGTDGSGTATLSYTIPTTLAKGTYNIDTYFDGDALYLVSSGNGKLTVN